MQKNYSATVLDHYRNPRNFGELRDATLEISELNPLCGDEIMIYLNINHQKIINCTYEARGCALSIAAASVLSERIINDKSQITDLKNIEKSDIEKMLVIKVSSAREGCVTLALNALKKSLTNKI